MSQSRLMSRFTVNTVLVIATMYMLFPLVWLATAVTKTNSGLFSSSMFEIDPGQFMSNMSELASADGGIFGRWYLNSFIYAGLGSIIGGLICVASGYAFDKYAFRGKEKLYGVILVGVLIPTTALSLPLYLLASRLGVVNTFWSVFVPVITFPFGVYLARVFSAGYVPDQVLEAARVDGAGELRTFFRIGLPMMAPGYVTIVLFQFVAIWNNFFLPLVMLSDRSLFPASLGLYVWNSKTTANPEYFAYVVAGAFSSVIPLVVAFVVLQRFWRSGLSAGSVK